MGDKLILGAVPCLSQPNCTDSTSRQGSRKHCKQRDIPGDQVVRQKTVTINTAYFNAVHHELREFTWTSIMFQFHFSLEHQHEMQTTLHGTDVFVSVSLHVSARIRSAPTGN